MSAAARFDKWWRDEVVWVDRHRSLFFARRLFDVQKNKIRFQYRTVRQASRTREGHM